jgi:glycine dehydrogenase subunit 1
MRYLPHTEEDIASMLETVGVERLEDLYSTVPAACRRSTPLNLPEPLSEWELDNRMSGLAATIAASPEYTVFLGAGNYEHFIPESVRYLLSRSEFVTAYTPYQPELSQGTLQAIYEYQTLVSRLLGMEIANASLYDGASALAEALLMSVRITHKEKIVISGAVHPAYRQVVRTYFSSTGYEIVELPYLEDGRTDLSALHAMQDVAGVALQSPNFFGCIEQLSQAAEISHSIGALFVTAFSEPLAYGLYKNPGIQGVDIACGEGQSMGIPQSFGGPGLGMFATFMKHVRSIPGRLVGLSRDVTGKRGFVLTLATREQHIRREKATSNICTNGSLCALATAMYMASLGRTGLGELARLNFDKTEYLKAAFRSAGFRIRFSSPTFNEFVVEFPPGFDALHEHLLEKKIIAGTRLDRYYPELENCWLLCATETKTREQMDRLVREVQS